MNLNKQYSTLFILIVVMPLTLALGGCHRGGQVGNTPRSLSKSFQKTKTEETKSAKAEENAEEGEHREPTTPNHLMGHWEIKAVPGSPQLQEFLRSGGNLTWNFTDKNNRGRAQATLEFTLPGQNEDHCHLRVTSGVTYCCPGMHRTFIDKRSAVITMSPVNCTETAAFESIWNDEIFPTYHFIHDSLYDSERDAYDQTVLLQGPYPPTGGSLSRFISLIQMIRLE